MKRRQLLKALVAAAAPGPMSLKPKGRPQPKPLKREYRGSHRQFNELHHRGDFRWINIPKG